MRLGSLVLVAVLAMFLSFAVSADTEPALEPTGETGSVEVAPDWAEAEDTATDWVEVDDEFGADVVGEDVVAEVVVDVLAEDMPADEFAEQVESNELQPADEMSALEAVPAEPAGEVAWDDFDDPDFNPGDPTAESADAPVAQAEADLAVLAVDESAMSSIEIDGPILVVGGITLGPVAVDAAGRVGRIHTVVSGDTLWDVSNAYLGTAWVWPSVWKDNGDIQNPHLIEPGDRLWISSTEIRRISDAEADEFLAGAETDVDEYVEVAAEIPADVVEEEVPASDDEFTQMASTDDFEIPEMDQLPVGMPDEGEMGRGTGRTVRVSMRDNMGFVSDAQLKASTMIVGSPSDRLHLSLLDTIYLGLGEGEVEVGDEFTFFRNVTDVRSPSTNALIGYHVDILGWAEVIEVTGASCVAVIRVSLAGTSIGDRVMPRSKLPSDIDVLFAEDGIEGEVAFLPANRTLMGTSDYVFVDVGAVQGVEIGTDLEVYDPGYEVDDKVRGQMVMTPDRVIADLVVVTVQEESAVAYVAHTRRELAVGDVVRGATRNFPEAF